MESVLDPSNKREELVTYAQIVARTRPEVHGEENQAPEELVQSKAVDEDRIPKHSMVDILTSPTSKFKGNQKFTVISKPSTS